MKRLCAIITALIMIISPFDAIFASDEAAVNIYIGSTLQQYKGSAVSGVLFLPMSECFRSLGIGDVVYDSENRVAKCTCGYGDVTVTAGKGTATVNLVPIELSAPAYDKDGVLMIPSDFIDNGIGGSVTYLSDSGRADIVPPEKTQPDTNADSDELCKKLLAAAKEENSMLSAGTDGMNSALAGGYRGGTKYQNISAEVNVELSDSENANIEKYGVRLETTVKTSETYQAQWCVSKTNTAENVLLDFEPGDVGIVSFWAKATDWGGDEAGGARILFQADGGSDHTYDTVGSRSFVVGEEWQQCIVPIYLASDKKTFGKTQMRFVFDLGYNVQTIYVSTLRAYKTENVAPEDIMPNLRYYEGIEDDALWRKEAYRRIEKYRKADMTVSVHGSLGNPINGAKINADMTKNEFMFGTCIETYGINRLDTESGRKYNELLLENFNTVVPGKTKWLDTAADDGASAIRLANWAVEHNLNFKGHTAFWEHSGAMPQSIIDSLDDADYSKAYDIYSKRIAECMIPFKNIAKHWDIINEITYHSSKVWQPHGEQMYADMYKLAHKFDPDCKLYINETGYNGDRSQNSVDEFKNKISTLQSLGAPIDGVGIQAHYVKAIYPQMVYNELDTLAEYTDELAITEYDIAPADETVSAPFLRDMLILTYSHPKATAFIMWGFTDKMHWRSNAPLYDKDYNPKPALAEWQRLVKNEWMTHESSITDETGKLAIRGFTGEYEIKVDTDGKEVTIPFRLVKDGVNKIDITVYDDDIKYTVSNSTEPAPQKISETTYSEILRAGAYPQIDNITKETTVLSDDYSTFKKSEMDYVPNYSDSLSSDRWCSLSAPTLKNNFKKLVGDNGALEFVRNGTGEITASMARKIFDTGTDMTQPVNFDFTIDRKQLDGNEQMEINLFMNKSSDSTGGGQRVLYSLTSMDGYVTESFFGMASDHGTFALQRDASGEESRIQKMRLSIIPRSDGGCTGKVVITDLSGNILYRGSCDYTDIVDNTTQTVSKLTGTDMLRWQIKQYDGGTDGTTPILSLSNFKISTTDAGNPVASIQDISRVNESFADFAIPTPDSGTANKSGWVLTSNADGNADKTSAAQTLITPSDDGIAIHPGNFDISDGDVRAFLSKSFTPAKDGEDLFVSCDIKFADRWYNWKQFGDFVISLTNSSDGSKNLNIAGRETGDTSVKLFSIGSSHRWYGDFGIKETQWQFKNNVWYSLFAALRKNAGGMYDVHIILSNMQNGTKMEYKKENVFSESDISATDGICIAARQKGPVSDDRELVIIKNMRIKTSDVTNTLRDGSNTAVIQFKNCSAESNPAAVSRVGDRYDICAAYPESTNVSSARIGVDICGADSAEIFTLDSINTLRPLTYKYVSEK